MTTSLTFADVVKSTGGKSVFNAYVTYAATEGKGLVKAVRPVLEAFSVDHAEMFLVSVHKAVADKRGTPPAPVSPQRLAAFRGMWKAYQWASWPAFLDTLQTIDPGWDDLIMLCNWFRSRKTAADKATKVAPTANDAKAEMQRLRDARAAAKVKAKAASEAAKSAPAVPLADRVRANPAEFMTAALATIDAFLLIEGKGKAAAFLNAASKGLREYQPRVVALQIEAAGKAAMKEAAAKLAAAEATAGK